MSQVVKEMKIDEVLRHNPNAGRIFMSYGMHCIGCIAAKGETVEEAAAVHGIDLNKLLEDLNK